METIKTFERWSQLGARRKIGRDSVSAQLWGDYRMLYTVPPARNKALYKQAQMPK